MLHFTFERADLYNRENRMNTVSIKLSQNLGTNSHGAESHTAISLVKIFSKEYKVLIDTLERRNKNISSEEEAREEWDAIMEGPVVNNLIPATPPPHNRSFTRKFNLTPQYLLKKPGALQIGPDESAEMPTGGRRKTKRRKKRHTKKRTYHSSKTRRAKRRKTHKK